MEERFWSKVDKSGDCWEWTAARHTSGYGVIRVDGKNLLAHRVAWTLERGSIPNGKYVLHRCDNPPCVNPGHLYIGTHADNMRDVAVRGDHGMAKLTREQVREIRQRYRPGIVTQAEIADEYGVDQTLVSKIVLRKQRVHVR